MKRNVAESGRYYKHVKFTAWINGVLRKIDDAKRIARKLSSRKKVGKSLLPELS